MRNMMGLTQEGLARRLGMEAYQIRDMESGKVEISLPIAKLLHYETGTNTAWILEGREPMGLEDRNLAISEDFATYGPLDFVFIPQVTGEISAGGGLIADNAVEMRIAFRREWIQRKGDHHNMSLVRVSGDSMEPTLLSGDLVLIDHNRNFIDPQGGIYAIAAGAIIMIKRLQVDFLTNRIRVISDNPRYEPAVVEPDKIVINGKVIWFGRELER